MTTTILKAKPSQPCRFDWFVRAVWRKPTPPSELPPEIGEQIVHVLTPEDFDDDDKVETT